MRHFSLSVTALLAAALFAGCAADGDEQNYKVLDDDRPNRFDAPDTGFDPNTKATEAPVFRITDAGDEPTRPDGTVILVSVSQDAAPAEGQDKAEPEAAPPAEAKGDVQKLGQPEAGTPDKVADDEPPEAGSILDRRNWNRVAVGPADGTTIHNPIYWRDCPVDDTYRDVLAHETVEARLNAAMENPDAGNWNATNALGGLVQPVKFGGDIVMLLWNVVQNHPLEEVTTPPLDQ